MGDRIYTRREVSDLPAAAAVEPSHHVVLVGSTGIDVDPTRNHELAADYDSERRMQGPSLFSSDGAWAHLQVLGVHGQDRVNYPTERERDHWAGCMRRTLAGFWTGGPLVVLGDMNANPFHDEITGREGLYALRKKDGVGISRKVSNEKTHSVSLYNPMWSLLVDGGGEAPGTYYFHRRTRTELLWHCIDQIIVSAHLEPRLVGRPRVCTSLMGDTDIPLLNAEGVPLRVDDKPVYSDHLPVQIPIDIKKVESCRISAMP
ncbi:endonuclease/exonuclease/phosphatase family protein [Sorangium sp. So ce131]|uniref:endonuclease/exonuclease/phosphatase family protein n=1 Tax=Sorangium sp. So ce131 TaxID=3133282 RepID=UPI003F5F443F